MFLPKLIDVHTHVNFNAFKDDADLVIRNTLDNGVGMILVGSQIDTSKRAVEIANKYEKENIYAAVGLHPVHLAESYHDHNEIGAPEGVSGFSSRKEEFNYDVYKTLASDSKVVAIGEFGLDYYRTESYSDVDSSNIKEKQFDIMRKQIRLALEVKKPVMIHCRPSGLGYGKPKPGTSPVDAYEDAINILKEEGADKIGGDMHFFVGDWDIAQKFLDFGFYLSFTGVITFAKQYDEVIKNTPLNRMMIETDAPYVSPALYRGKRNEPMYVAEVAKRIAELKGISYDEVAHATTQNAIKLFNL